jgi:hypothetical protein
MKCPIEIYQPSNRIYTGLPDIDYPLHDKTIVVTRCGRICLGKKKINFSTVFAGQAVGIKEVHDDIWLVSFMNYDLGYFDLETRVLEPLENPFGPKVSRPQWVSETLVSRIYAGVFQFRVSRGRVFNFLATVSSWVWLTAERSIPFG